MKITVLSKDSFCNLLIENKINDDNVESFRDCFISISGSGDNDTPFRDNHLNVLNLEFDDIINENHYLTKNGKQLRIFNKEDASKIIEFINLHKDKENLYVHCLAGISRSGAVGEFISDYFGKDYFQFRKLNPKIQPNPYVLLTLNKQL